MLLRNSSRSTFDLLDSWFVCFLQRNATLTRISDFLSRRLQFLEDALVGLKAGFCLSVCLCLCLNLSASNVRFFLTLLSLGPRVFSLRLSLQTEMGPVGLAAMEDCGRTVVLESSGLGERVEGEADESVETELHLHSQTQATEVFAHCQYMHAEQVTYANAAHTSVATGNMNNSDCQSNNNSNELDGRNGPAADTGGSLQCRETFRSNTGSVASDSTPTAKQQSSSCPPPPPPSTPSFLRSFGISMGG